MPSVHGNIITGSDIEAAALTTVERWIETYLAEIERQNDLDPRTLPLPRAYVTVADDQLDVWPEDQLPAIAVLSPGTASEPRYDADHVAAGYAVNVAVLVSARDKETTKRLAHLYGAAILLLMVEQRSLDGFASSSRWRGQRWDALSPEDNRTLAAAINVFEVAVDPVVTTGGGRKEPLDDPYAPEPWPEVSETEIETEIES